jgi:peptide/nickel transport system permease protein
VLLLAATLVVFLLLHITPGDPAQLLLGDLGTSEAIAALRKAMGLDRPLPIQYAEYLSRLGLGDLGLSVRTQRPVLEMIAERFPATITLSAAATLIAAGLGIPIGILAALRRGGGIETTAFAVSLVGQAMPGFWLGLLLIQVFAVGLRWLPVSGSDSPAHMILPAVTLSTFMLGLLVRISRSAMLEVMGEDFIRTARAKGLGEPAVLRRHALRSALIPVVTVIGLQIGTTLGGAVVTETIFAWPGIGSLAFAAISQRDYPVVQGLVLVSAAIFLVINLAIDILYAYLDPRIMYR